MAVQREENQRGKNRLPFFWLPWQGGRPLTLILFEPVNYLVTLVQTKGFISDFPCFSYSKFIHYFSPGDFAEQTNKKAVFAPVSEL